MPGATYTLPDIAREAGVSESTCRRYVKNFSAFIPMESRGRVNLYHTDSIPVLKRIKHLYDMGYATQEVWDIVSQDFDQIIETSPMSANNGKQSQVENPPNTTDIVNELIDQLQSIKDRDTDIIKIKHFIVTMKKQLQEVEAGQREMPSFENIRYILNRLKRLEQRVEGIENWLKENNDPDKT